MFVWIKSTAHFAMRCDSLPSRAFPEYVHNLQVLIWTNDTINRDYMPKKPVDLYIRIPTAPL